MRGFTTPNSKFSRMLKKPASFVLASLRAPRRTARVRLGLIARCGRAGQAFLSILQSLFRALIYEAEMSAGRCGWILPASILRPLFEES